MLFIEEEDELFDPVRIGLGSTGGHMAEGGCSTDLVEQFWLHGIASPEFRSVSIYRTSHRVFLVRGQDFFDL